MGTTKVDVVADTETLVVMLVASGKTVDSQWFDYRPDYFMPIVRVEWDADTMFAALPSETAGYLLSNGYARPMTDAEVEEYTKPAAAPPPPVAKPKPKGDQP